ncbi:hypothetical protein MPH_10730 [Macrophomina phaseolina MS6]|uniref:Uncharacterized protein n=1 Tax=Macrophomina phaseolina (strain MS6) TaxID=1126212 RepID=K2QQH7_MACPH|nr:hypothetical protein MPH_10730 [Macrophomina phaseolina MS6]
MAPCILAPGLHHLDSLTRDQWKANCLPKWVAFKESIDRSNRGRVRRLTMSHWHTREDFEWIDENLPNLTELDLSDLQDMIICDGNIPDGNILVAGARGKLLTACHGYFTWSEVTSLKLWARLEKIWVRHWGCDRLNDSKHRHVNTDGWIGGREPDGSRIQVEIRSRRETHSEEISSDVTGIIGRCEKLRTLAIRGPSLDPDLNRSWRPRQACLEDEGSHAHVCAVVKGLEANAPESLRAVEFYQAEFAPQVIELLRDKARVRRFSISFGDVLRRYSPVREIDIGRDDPLELAAKHAKYRAYPSKPEDEECRVHDLYPKASCEYHISQDWKEDSHFHATLDRATFPRRKLLDWLSDKDTRSTLLHWTNSPHRTVAARPTDLNEPCVFNAADAAIARYLVTDRESRPLPGLNDLLLQLSAAFTHCADLSCNDDPSAVPVSFFSFLAPSPNPLLHAATGIFGSAANGRDLRAFHRLHRHFAWRPLWDADPLFAPAGNFPWNVGIELPPGGRLEGKRLAVHVLGPILRGLRSLANVDVPVRLLVGNRPKTERAAATGLYWGAQQTVQEDDVWAEVGGEGVGTSWLAFPVVDPSLFHRGIGRERFCQPPREKGTQVGVGGGVGKGDAGWLEPTPEDLMLYAGLDAGEGPYTIAGCVDELVVRYQDWTGMLPEGEVEEGDDKLMKCFLQREARGWQRWWRDYSVAFTRLRKLSIRMPLIFDAYESSGLATLVRNGVKRGTWLLRPMLAAESGHRLAFVLREWVRTGGPRDVVFTEDEKIGGNQDFKEVGITEHEWWSKEREVAEGMRLRETFFKALDELKIMDSEVQVEATPVEEEDTSAPAYEQSGFSSSSPYLSVPNTQVRRSPTPHPSPFARPIIPIFRPVEHGVEEEQPEQSQEITELPEKSPTHISETPLEPVDEQANQGPSLERASKGRKVRTKKTNISKKRARARADKEENGADAGSEEPPSKKTKVEKEKKKSRWERELEALKS